MMPIVLLALFGAATWAVTGHAMVLAHGWPGLALMFFPWAWVLAVSVLGAISALHHRNPWLVPLASLAVLYVLLSHTIWLVHGLKGFFTGREPERDKPTRVAHVVD